MKERDSRKELRRFILTEASGCAPNLKRFLQITSTIIIFHISMKSHFIYIKQLYSFFCRTLIYDIILIEYDLKMFDCQNSR